MNRIEKVIITLLSIFISATAIARNIDVDVEPANWWTHMNMNVITLTSSAEFDGKAYATINYPGIKILKTYSDKNNKYLFIDIEIAEQVSAGTFPINFRDSRGNTGSFEFSIQNRKTYTQQTLSSKDIIYQIVPDRFKDGETKNDKISGYFEVMDRTNPMGIHGGDIAGITSSIDYISNLGFTCIDILPVFESNLMTMSYQKNGITNSYQIDKRLGETSDYLDLINLCHQKNLKVMKTMIFHQLGKHHPFSQNPPSNSFFHNSEFKYESNHKVISTDPYSSEYDKKIAYGTWQELNMPVLNQGNESVQNLLIQNCIWWLETSQVDILKIDEMNRNSPAFLAHLFDAIHSDFPDISIVSDHSPSDININFWQDIAISSGFTKEQIHITDYPIAESLSDAFSIFNEDNNGLQSIYTTVTEDHKYHYPFGNIVMADNHHLSRLFSNADKEINQAKMMLGYILTTRGIPCILYGTEWLLDGSINKGKGFVRKDFPGGWSGDNKNGFTQSGFNIQEGEFYNYFLRLANWRNKNSDLFSGDFVQFAPEDGTYAYYRKHNDKAAFIFINNTESQIRINNKKYSEILDRYKIGYDIVSESTFNDFTNLLIGAKSILILHLKN